MGGPRGGRKVISKKGAKVFLEVGVGAVGGCDVGDVRVPRASEITAESFAEKRVTGGVVGVETGGAACVDEFVECANQPLDVGTVGTKDEIMFADNSLSIFDKGVGDSNRSI